MTAENLVRLGADRLAEILLEVADTRAELKRRLRMELAAEQGAEHLLAEIDRRMTLLANSRGAVSWRQRPAFVRDLDGVRGLIAGRLRALDLAAAQDRILVFLTLAPKSIRRVRDKEGAVDSVFARAAADAVNLLAHGSLTEGAARLATALAAQPSDWKRWISGAVGDGRDDLARAVLLYVGKRTESDWSVIMRRLAKVAGDPPAYRDTFSAAALKTPSVAADVAAQFLRKGHVDEARQVLEGAIQPGLIRSGTGQPTVDPDWEGVWIDYLERAGRGVEAQDARWASFMRNLSAERLRAFIQRLDDFEDVEAEDRAFAIAGEHPDAGAALSFLMGWPALREAARLIEERGPQLRLEPDLAEAWARKLRRRYPAAAERLLRRAAAEAFRRRAFTVSSRLTEEADSIGG